MDSLDNSYVTGAIYVVDFYPGPQIDNKAPVAGPDIYLVKYDPDGAW